MMQIKKLTHEEKVEMYNKCSKEELINMLIEANKHLELLRPDVDINLHPKTNNKKKFSERRNEIESEIVSLRIAKKLKDDGFIELCEHYYQDIDLPYSPKGLKRCKNGETLNHNNYDEWSYSAPTIGQAKKFLTKLNYDKNNK